MTEQAKMTKTQAVNKMVDILLQIDSLNEGLKIIKEDCKELGYDPAIISAVAKAIVSDKLKTLEEKSTAILDMIEEARA